MIPLQNIVARHELTKFGGFVIITFVIISFPARGDSNREVVITAGVRIIAISIGIVIALALACTLFPVYASGKVNLLSCTLPHILPLEAEAAQPPWSGSLVCCLATERQASQCVCRS